RPCATRGREDEPRLASCAARVDALPAEFRLRRQREQHLGQRQTRWVLRRRLRRGQLAVRGRQTSCGVIVSDGERILLGHATRSPRWDIPKGLAEPGEDFAEAAARELREETGLVVPPAALVELGVHPYLRGKDLALYAWRGSPLPDPQGLACTSHFTLSDGTVLPEFDRFGIFAWDDALNRVGKNMARVLASIPRNALCGASS